MTRALPDVPDGSTERAAGDASADRSVVAATIQGDPGPFRALVERETGLVFRICYRILGHAEEAEDATQEAFVLAHRALPTYRGEGTLRAWLARIASRHALRMRARRPSTARLGEEVDHLDTAGPGGQPLAHALESERRRLVLRLLGELPDAHREVLVLMYFGDLSVSEIATATGRPVGTIKTHLHRGLEHLRRRLGPEWRP